MKEYLTDFALLSLCLIGLTALMGTISRFIAQLLFGGKRKDFFLTKSQGYQQNWKKVERRDI
ncbi:hypothetical protein ACFQPF_08935 [Fictibacillus iocasae]|uniref:Uncharacterized protein n=1 Tax=Fictibacillus iocasae TaxID=2715437 RepID=A0ABW2NQG9_9BACL